MTRHRWDKPLRTDHKTERECKNNCGIVKVTRHESEGGREKHWPEFWRGLDRVDVDGRSPACKAVAYDARNYPL